MEKVIQRLISLTPTIREMMSITGTAGLTYGIIYRGELIHTRNFGYRDIEAKLPVYKDTIFQVASLTKNMVAAIIGMLVEEGKMDWNTPIKDILPDWNIEDQAVHNLTTIVDCLAHRTGLQMNNYWLESNNNIIIPATDSMKLINGLKPVLPFRRQFQYNNLGYEIAGHVIDKLSGTSWNQMLQTRLFDPLDMNRTGTHENFAGPDNVSKAYGALSSGTPVRIGDAKVGPDTVAGPAAAVRSTLSDMLQLTKAWLRAAEHQFQNRVTSTPGSPLKQVGTIMSNHVPMPCPSYHESSYGLGFARTQLPGPMGVLGLNGVWLDGPPGSPKGMPIVGKGGPKKLVVWHQGSHPGVLAALNMVPEDQSAVLVMSNTLALNDCADWVGQMLLESLLDVPDKNDYLQITKDTVATALAWYPAMEKALRGHPETEAPRKLEDYVGVYRNEVVTVHIDVTLTDGHLNIVFQGLDDEVWPLRHWEHDTFTWLPESRDAIASRGRFTFQTPDYYKIKFFVLNKWVGKLTWVHEGWNLPEGEEFFKVEDEYDENYQWIRY